MILRPALAALALPMLALSACSEAPIPGSQWTVSQTFGEARVSASGNEYSMGASAGKTTFLDAETLAYSGDKVIMDCTAADSFDIDIFFGNDRPASWESQIIFAALPAANGSWTADFPEAYYATITPNGDVVSEWSSGDGFALNIRDLRCTSRDRLVATITYSGTLTHSDGTPVPAQTITGQITAEARLIREDQW